MSRKETPFEDYDAAQAEAAKKLERRYRNGYVPGLDGLVNELSKVTKPEEVDEVIRSWDSGNKVRLPKPTITSPDNGY